MNRGFTIWNWVSWGWWPALLVAAAVLMPSALRAQEPDPAPAESNYGRTPDTAIPYRDFQDPYTRFFQEVTEFRGSGRNEAPVETLRALRIGFFGPTDSAPDGDLGQQMLRGVTLALEQANAAGGYRGTPFELVTRRDTGLWGSSSNEMVGFRYQDDVLAVIGSIDGANTHIALRVALKIKLPMVNTATTDPTLTETRIPWLLRCMADDRQQGYALAHHIFKELGLTKVVAFRVNDRFGRTGIGEFRDAARRLRNPLRLELRWNRGDRDFADQLDRIAQTEPEAIVLWGNASDSAAVVRAIRKRKLAVQIFGCDRLASDTFLLEAGKAAEGVVAVATCDPTRDDPRLKAFVESFGQRFNAEPDTFAAHAFDGANILFGAIEKAGPNRVKIRDALHAYKDYEGATGHIEFDTTLNDIGPVYIATVDGGKFVYQEAKYDSIEQVDAGLVPYRRLVQSPPAARNAARVAENTDGLYRIGCCLPLDEAGRHAVRGVRLALADDAARHPHDTPIELLVRDLRGNWGNDTTSLVELVHDKQVLALIGSTERRGTHLAEMLAAKFHFPIVTLCNSDPTVTAIPLPWIFRVARTGTPLKAQFARRYQEQYKLQATPQAAWGYDAGALLAIHIRAGAHDRLALRNRLANSDWQSGVSGTYRFDALGNRIDRLEVGAANVGRPDTVRLGADSEGTGKPHLPSGQVQAHSSTFAEAGRLGASIDAEPQGPALDDWRPAAERLGGGK